MGDKTITQIVDSGDGDRGTITVITKDDERGTERASSCEYGGGAGTFSKAEATERATQDSIWKH